jgi:hypothetical protein
LRSACSTSTAGFMPAQCLPACRSTRLRRKNQRHDAAVEGL